MHALVALRHGVVVERITLWLLGGVAELEGNAKSPGDEFRIAVVGPLTSLAIGIAAGVLAGVVNLADGPPLVVAMLSWLAGINVVLAIFNLAPAAPLDGGRVLHAAVWAATHDSQRATVVAATAGRVFGVLLIAWGVFLFLTGSGGLWFALLGWFVINAASAEEQHAVMQQRLGSLRVRDVMSASPLTVAPGIDIEHFVNDYAMRGRFSTFPVVDADGTVRGLITLRRVKPLPVDRWRDVRVADLACPMGDVPIARPDEALIDAVERMRDDCAEGRMLVLDGDERLVGILSPSDVKRALELAQIVKPPERPVTV